jgi:hypothetical protein
VQSKDRQTHIPLTVKRFKDATQYHSGGASKADGAELHEVKIVGNVLKVEKQNTFTKFDVADSTGVVEVALNSQPRAEQGPSGAYPADREATQGRDERQRTTRGRFKAPSCTR